MVRPRVLIADDHRLVAAGLKELLEAQCDVVGVVSDGGDVLDTVRRQRPHILVQDLSMPPADGFDIIRQVREFDRAIKVVVVTMSEEPARAAEAFHAGASAYVLKRCAAPELLDAVRCAMAEQSYITPLIAGSMIASLSKSTDEHREDPLTSRQKQVLALLTDGKSMKEVGAILNLTARTVAFHKYRMMQILKLDSNAALIRFAINHHLTTTG